MRTKPHKACYIILPLLIASCASGRLADKDPYPNVVIYLENRHTSDVVLYVGQGLIGGCGSFSRCVVLVKQRYLSEQLRSGYKGITYRHLASRQTTTLDPIPAPSLTSYLLIVGMRRASTTLQLVTAPCTDGPCRETEPH